MQLIEKILEFLLGTKYYANTIGVRGGQDNPELSCFIFSTKEDAEKHRISLMSNRSFYFIETVSFRSRKNYQRH